jgi:GNAT superfamily N-acetyltransferase
MQKDAQRQSKIPDGVQIRNTFRPGDVGAITYLHGTLYAQESGWDHTFEAYVAGPLAEFAKNQTDRERIWIVEHDDIVCGSIAIVDAGGGSAQLRWFLLHPQRRGVGLGKELVRNAIAFCRERGYRSVFLWTVSSLPAAAHLYRAAGFTLTEERTRELWGAVVTEQRYDLAL